MGDIANESEENKVIGNCLHKKSSAHTTSMATEESTKCIAGCITEYVNPQ